MPAEELGRSEDQCCEATEPCADVPCANFKGHNINIEPKDHGYIIRVGCKTFCVEKAEKLIKLLGKYLNNPNGVEREFNASEQKLDALV